MKTLMLSVIMLILAGLISTVYAQNKTSLVYCFRNSTCSDIPFPGETVISLCHSGLTPGLPCVRHISSQRGSNGNCVPSSPQIEFCNKGSCTSPGNGTCTVIANGSCVPTSTNKTGLQLNQQTVS